MERTAEDVAHIDELVFAHILGFPVALADDVANGSDAGFHGEGCDHVAALFLEVDGYAVGIQIPEPDGPGVVVAVGTVVVQLDHCLISLSSQRGQSGTADAQDQTQQHHDCQNGAKHTFCHDDSS